MSLTLEEGGIRSSFSSASAASAPEPGGRSRRSSKVAHSGSSSSSQLKRDRDRDRDHAKKRPSICFLPPSSSSDEEAGVKVQSTSIRHVLSNLARSDTISLDSGGAGSSLSGSSRYGGKSRGGGRGNGRNSHAVDSSGRTNSSAEATARRDSAVFDLRDQSTFVADRRESSCDSFCTFGFNGPPSLDGSRSVRSVRSIEERKRPQRVRRGRGGGSSKSSRSRGGSDSSSSSGDETEGSGFFQVIIAADKHAPTLQDSQSVSSADRPRHWIARSDEFACGLMSILCCREGVVGEDDGRKRRTRKSKRREDRDPAVQAQFESRMRLRRCLWRTSLALLTLSVLSMVVLVAVVTWYVDFLPESAAKIAGDVRSLFGTDIAAVTSAGGGGGMSKAAITAADKRLR